MKAGIIILVTLFSSLVFAQNKVTEKEIYPGIIHKKILDKKDTLSINILKVDLTKGDYSLRSVKGFNELNKKETTSEMVKSFKDSNFTVVAAINGDFFEADGEIIDNMISEGKFVKAVKFTDSPFNPFVNSQFVFTYNKKPLIEQLVFTADLILPDGTIEKIYRINSKTDSNSISLYNSYQGEYTPKSRWITYETELKPIKISDDTLLFIAGKRNTGTGNTEINKDKLILSGTNGYAKYLEREIKENDTVKVVLKFNPDIKNIETLVGGWPRLVVDGKNIALYADSLEGTFPKFSEVKHPRTGVGFSKDSTTIYFITVDGRQESSSGVSLKQFADIMISEGIYQGLNFDGGGSTTMVINGEVVNAPSDITGEREVGNCLMLIKK